MNKIENSTALTPEWVKDAVFYQIFPDRFAKSVQVPKPANLQPWGERPTSEKYQGGDLIGIVEHLDYLRELGINAIYLNPVFQSASNHRYHPHDYAKVDPLLGGDDALHLLVKECHSNGIRVILDGVFNHASRGFFQFNDILENGPYSPWIDWFYIQDWPLAPYDGAKPANYASWWNNRALPKLNTDNPQVRDYIMGIAEYWLQEFDIDGWRLDVPEEITTEGFWEEFRTRVKAIKAESYIIGEIWHDAPEWLRGDRFDALMNYQFAAAVIAFSAGDRVSPALVEGKSYNPYPAIDALEFGQRIRHNLSLYDWETTLGQYNLIDSHDTPRMLSLARGDKKALKLATFLQMTLPGVPAIYYGDEIGLRGTTAYDQPHDDADARWAFPWHDLEKWDNDLLSFFKELIGLRHSHRALRRGKFEQIYAGGNTYAFTRHIQEETLLVIINSDDQASEVFLPSKPLFEKSRQLRTINGPTLSATVGAGMIHIEVPAREGVVLATS